MNDLQKFIHRIQSGLQLQERQSQALAIELAPWYDAPQVHNTPEFSGNVEAATIADKLFARWADAANSAERADWNDEARNVIHQATWGDLYNFRAAYWEVEEAHVTDNLAVVS